VDDGTRRAPAGGRRVRTGLLVIAVMAVALLVVTLIGVAPSSRPARAGGRTVTGVTLRDYHGRRIAVWPESLLHHARIAGHEPQYVTARGVLDAVGRVPAGDVATVHVLTVGGLQRYYVEIAPTHEGAGHARSVYVIIHGHHMTPVGMEHMTGFPTRAKGAVLVYPAGIGESWNAGGCCWFAHSKDVDDVAFIAAVVKQVLAQHADADRAHVYAVGFSNGGRLTYRLACDLPGTFGALAAVEAVPVIDCKHLHPIDIEIVARARDPLLRFGDERPLTLDGYKEPTVTAAVAEWEHLDGCVGAPVTKREGTTELRTWDRCRNGTSVQYVLYAGAGHLWTWGHPPNPAVTDLILDRFGPDLVS
jgi:polyhydroxybutyrate depolymerase